MSFLVSRSAWSVIGWVTISPPKINSKISKILAPNFPDFQISKFSKLSQISKKSQNFQKVRPYVLETSCPLGLAVLEILEGFGNFAIFEKPEHYGIEFWKFSNLSYTTQLRLLRGVSVPPSYIYIYTYTYRCAL